MRLYRLVFALALVAIVATGFTRQAAAAAPIAADDAYSMEADSTLVIDIPGVLANDSDPNNAQISAIQNNGMATAHGGLSWLNTGGSFSYTPEPGYSGTDSFQYTITNGQEDSAPATVTITIIPNTPPVASDDDYHVDEGTTLTIAAPGVLANDSDADGDAIYVAGNSQPANGTLGLGSDGSLTYTPNPGFIGTDIFSYYPSDGTDNGSDAAIRITVNDVNHAPYAGSADQLANQDQELSIAAPGVVHFAFDEDGDSLTAVLVNGTSHGSVVLDPSGGYTYTPDPGYLGDDSFDFQVSDGTNLSNVATLIIHVWSVPIATVDNYFTPRGTDLVVDAGGGLLANDVEPGGQKMTVVITSQPSYGALSVNSD